MVDEQTRERLSCAKDSEEMLAILNSNGVFWSERACCLRHTDCPVPCRIPVMADIESWIVKEEVFVFYSMRIECNATGLSFIFCKTYWVN